MGRYEHDSFLDALSGTKASANVGAGTRRLRDLGSALGDLSPQGAERGISFSEL